MLGLFQSDPIKMVSLSRACPPRLPAAFSGFACVAPRFAPALKPLCGTLRGRGALKQLGFYPFYPPLLAFVFPSLAGGRHLFGALKMPSNKKTKQTGPLSIEQTIRLHKIAKKR